MEGLAHMELNVLRFHSHNTGVPESLIGSHIPSGFLRLHTHLLESLRAYLHTKASLLRSNSTVSLSGSHTLNTESPGVSIGMFWGGGLTHSTWSLRGSHALNTESLGTSHNPEPFGISPNIESFRVSPMQHGLYEGLLGLHSTTG